MNKTLAKVQVPARNYYFQGETKSMNAKQKLRKFHEILELNTLEEEKI